MAKTVTTLEMKLEADDNASGPMGRLAQQLQNVATKYDLQQRAAAQLKAKMDSLDTTTAKGAASAQRLQLQYDKLQLAMRNTEVQGLKLKDSITAGATASDKHTGSLTGLIGKLGIAGAAFGVLSKAAEGFTLGASLEQNRMNLGTLLQDVERGNAVFEDAIAFGQKYGFTQKEMGGSIAAAAGIIKNSNQTTEKTLEVMARLASLNPAEGIEGATFAIKELASGDIVSLAERFNIAKSEANAMKDAIAAGADPIVVLDAALSKMGVSTQVLSDRMEGQNGALLRTKLAAERAMLGLGDLMVAMGATYILEAFAAGLGTIADGLKFVADNTTAFLNMAASMNTVIADGTARMIERGASFTEYAAAMESVGQSQAALTEAEYAQVAAMLANGVAAEQAIAAVQNLSAAGETLQGVFFKTMDGAYATAEAQQALTDKTMALGSATPETSAAVVALLDELSNTGDVDAFADAIDNLSINQEYAASTSFGYADAQIASNDAIAAAIDPTNEAADALFNKANDDLVAGQAALEHAQFEQDLAYALEMSQGGAVNAAVASAWLAQQYGAEVGAVRTLIDATNKLNAARAGQMGVDLGRDIGASIPKTAAYAPATIARAQRAGARSSGRSGGGGGGRSGGKASSAKSPEAKAAEQTQKELDKIQDKTDKATRDYQKKMEQAKQEHVDKLQAIDEEYFQKNLEATNAFNEDKFASQLSFQQGLIDLDQDLYDQALAAEDQYWNESQAMAQAGHGQQAADYYAAGVALADIVAQNAQEMRVLRAQIAAEEDEAERAKLEQRLARLAETNAQEEQLARDNIEKIKAGGDELEQERQEAIDQENADYSDAQDSLKAAFGETMDDIERSYDDMGEAARRLADKIVAAAELAAAAIAAIPSPPSGGEASGAEGGESGGESQGSYAVGTGDRGLPRTGLYTGHAGEIIPSIGQSNQIRAMGGLSDVLSRSAATASTGSNSNTSNTATMSVNMAAGSVVVGGSNAQPGQIKAAVAAGVEIALEKFNGRIGRSATNKGRSG